MCLIERSLVTVVPRIGGGKVKSSDIIGRGGDEWALFRKMLARKLDETLADNAEKG